MDNHIKVPVDLKKEDILALDIATHTGYYSTHGSGTWDFTKKKSNDWKQHLDFRTTLLNFIQKNNIRLIAAEDVNVGGRFSGMRKLSEFRGILMEICDTLGLPEPIFANVSAIKKFATNNGNASKEEMILAMKDKYGQTPVDDNEADACHIFHLICKRYRL